jgi:hypothetical protein
MAREARLWSWLSKARQGLREELHIGRVENAVGSGMPDVEGQVKRGQQFWIELKSCKRPANETTPLRFKFQKGQPEWIERRISVGGYVWLLLQVGQGASRAIYLVHGRHIDEVAKGVVEGYLLELSERLPHGRDLSAEMVVLHASGLAHV